jgi:putative peptidoglycan lipid II flippase
MDGMTVAAEPADESVVTRRAGVVAIFTLASRVLGYVRDAVLANLFGASGVYDAFIVALTIPNLLRRLVAEGSLVVTFVPLLAQERTSGGLPAMQRFTRAVLGLLLPVLLVLSGAGVLFPETMVDLFAVGFDPERAKIAADLTRIMMPYIGFISLVALAGGALNTVGVFAPPAAAPILLNVAIIGAAVGLGGAFEEPIVAVAWGVLVGGALQLALQLAPLARRGLLVRPSWEPGHPAVRQLLTRMGPGVFGVAVYQLNIVVIRQIGSFLPTGQLSWYYNATRLQEFALGVFAVSVSVAALPTLSEHAAREDWAAMGRTFRRALRVTNFITIPTTAGLLALGGPIVGVLFRHGQFGAEDARHTGELLQILALAIVPIGAVRVTVPTFYALGDTKTPVVAATLSLVATLGLGFGLVGRFEIHGLCAAMTAAAGVQLVVLWWLLRRAMADRQAQAPQREDESVVGHALRCAAAILPSTVFAWLCRDAFPWFEGRNLTGALALGAIAAVAILGYLIGARLLRIGELEAVLGGVRRRLPRRLGGRRG